MTVNTSDTTKNANAVLARTRMVGVNLMVRDVEKSTAFYSRDSRALPRSVTASRAGPSTSVSACCGSSRGTDLRRRRGTARR